MAATTSFSGQRWAAVAGLSGLALLLWWLLRSEAVLPVQTAIHPVRPELLSAGERLFSWCLLGHGALLLLLTLICLRRSVGRREEEVEPLHALPQFPRETSSDPWWLLAVVVAAGLVLRLIGLDTGLWFDEVVT